MVVYEKDPCFQNGGRIGIGMIGAVAIHGGAGNRHIDNAERHTRETFVLGALATSKEGVPGGWTGIHLTVVYSVFQRLRAG